MFFQQRKRGGRRAVEKDGPWKARKTKNRFPSLPTALGNPAKPAGLPLFPQPRLLLVSQTRSGILIVVDRKECLTPDTREFLYVDDAAEGVVLATEHCNGGGPINLATGVEISILDLALLIKDLVGYGGEILWDSSMPDGQPRRCLDVQRASQEFGFLAETPLKAGLSRTIAWFTRERLAKARGQMSDA